MDLIKFKTNFSDNSRSNDLLQVLSNGQLADW